MDRLRPIRPVRRPSLPDTSTDGDLSSGSGDRHHLVSSRETITPLRENIASPETCFPARETFQLPWEVAASATWDLGRPTPPQSEICPQTRGPLYRPAAARVAAEQPSPSHAPSSPPHPPVGRRRPLPHLISEKSELEGRREGPNDGGSFEIGSALLRRRRRAMRNRCQASDTRRPRPRRRLPPPISVGVDYDSADGVAATSR